MPKSLNPGDVVRFIGFFDGESPAHIMSHHVSISSKGIGKIGIVLTKFTVSEGLLSVERYDVAWGDGTIGRSLYGATLEMISDDR